MKSHPSKDWCPVFEAIDGCTSFDQLATLSVTTLSAAMGCTGGSVQEVVYFGNTPRLRRHFVTAALGKNVPRFIANFDKICASLLGGAERKELAIYLMGSRIDHALEVNFDPRPVWRGSRIRNVLTMRVPWSDATDIYFTFNRDLGADDFETADLRDARQLFSMISATSRRLYAEERLHLSGLFHDDPSRQTILGTVGRGEGRYLLSRIPCEGAGRQARLRSSDDAVVYARPSNDSSGIERLTRAELTIAALAAHGHSNKGIARLQSLSVYTVENHLKSIYRKLGVSGRGKLAPTFLLS
jgi:DNA-binding CsgD family transcriptional regulator